MATIVTQYHQPYWQQAALGLATNLLGNALQRSQEADNNRKMNAVIQKSMSEANAAAGQYAGQNLLTGQPLPDGYNSDAWAKTMHDSYTPMTQFDLGTDAATGRLSTPRIPTQMEYLSALLGNLDTQRFGGLNTKSAYEAFAPVIAAGEQARAAQQAEQQRAMQQKYSDALFGAQDRDTYGRILNAYAASGYAPEKALAAMQKNYEHMYPNYEHITNDSGGQIINSSFDPKTGAYSPQISFNKTMTPDEVAKIGLGYDKLGFERDKFATEMAQKYQTAGQTGQNKFMEAQKQMFEQLGTIETALRAQLEEAQTGYDTAESPDVRAQYDTKRKNLMQQLEAVQQQRYELYNAGLAAMSGSWGQQQQRSQGSGQVGKGVKNYSELINKIAQEEGIDPELIMAVMQHESNGNPNAVSHAGAQGLMQLMPDTAKRFGVTNPFDPEQNIRGGAKYLKWLSDRYKGDVDKIAWGYNAGEGNADKGHMPRPEETGPYRKNVASLYNSLKSAKGQQQKPQQGAQANPSNVVLYNPKNPSEKLTYQQLEEIGNGDVNAGIKRAKEEGGYADMPEQNVGSPYISNFLPSYPSTNLIAQNPEVFTAQNPTTVDAISGAAPNVYSPEYPGFFSGVQSPQVQAEETPNLLSFTPEKAYDLHQATMRALENERFRNQAWSGFNIPNIGYSPLSLPSYPSTNLLSQNGDVFTARGEEQPSQPISKRDRLIDYFGVTGDDSQPRQSIGNTPTPPPEAGNSIAERLFNTNNASNLLSATPEADKYVDLAGSWDAWENPDNLLRRSYMGETGQQPLLDRLNGWDGSVLWEPERDYGYNIPNILYSPLSIPSYPSTSLIGQSPAMFTYPPRQQRKYTSAELEKDSLSPRFRRR